MELMFCTNGFLQGRNSAKLIAFTVLLSVWTLRTSAQISSVTPIPKNSVTGGTVLLSTQVTATVRSFSWFRGTGADAANQILNYIPGLPNPQETYPPYIGRVTGFPNGSMELKNLMTSDRNNYTVLIQFTNPTTVQQVTVEVKVYVTLPAEPLPGWAIAVIVVVVLAVCAVIAFLVYWFKFRKPAAGTSNSVPMDTTKQKPEPSTNAKPNGTADDVQYSSVSFVPKAAAPAKPATNENTVYSEVRR